MTANPASTSRLPADATAADKPSRDAVKAEREAAKEAKKAAKAAALAKKASADASSTTPGASASNAAQKPPGAKTAIPRDLENGAEAVGRRRQASERSATSNNTSTDQTEARTGQKSSVVANSKGSIEKTQAIPAASSTAFSTTVLGGTSLFGNVSYQAHADDIKKLVVSASYRAHIHPSVLILAQHLSTFTIVGADARAIAVLKALRDFILDYHTPEGAVLSRDLVSKLGPQIGFLVYARPLGASVGHAIRYLKYEVSVTPVELDEEEAKERIISRIDHFVRDRITYATRVIAQNLATSKIKDGDVILTFARSSVVQQTIAEAWERGIQFSVIVVDARPMCEGRQLLSALVDLGIPCSYGLLTSLGSLISQASIVLLGTATLLANGALYARAGTAPCAMMAKARNIPVIVCCETYKFSERIQLDGFVVNEAGNPTDIFADEDGEAQNANLIKASEWKSSSSLGTVNLLYDLTPPRYITAVASEVGLSGPESVGVILRDYKSVLYGQ